MSLMEIHIASDLVGDTGIEPSDLVGVNGLHASRCRSFAQFRSFFRLDEVATGRQDCCTLLLYWCPKAWPRPRAKMQR